MELLCIGEGHREEKDGLVSDNQSTLLDVYLYIGTPPSPDVTITPFVRVERSNPSGWDNGEIISSCNFIW